MDKDLHDLPKEELKQIPTAPFCFGGRFRSYAMQMRAFRAILRFHIPVKSRLLLNRGTDGRF